MASHEGAAVFISVTTLDGGLARLLEPRAAQPSGRLNAIRELSEAGVPVGVMVAPIIPGLTDHEMPAILNAAAEAGAQFAGYTLLRLPHAVAGLFESWLSRHYPQHKERVLGRIRDLRGGKLTDSRFGLRMRGEGVFADAIRKLFVLGCQRAGIPHKGPQLSTEAFRRPGGTQRLLFE
jgi:DNA repair photolyase